MVSTIDTYLADVKARIGDKGNNVDPATIAQLREGIKTTRAVNSDVAKRSLGFLKDTYSSPAYGIVGNPDFNMEPFNTAFSAAEGLSKKATPGSSIQAAPAAAAQAAAPATSPLGFSSSQIDEVLAKRKKKP
jgi:hypothetical protein